jgi:hypothetical protein
MKAFFFIRHVSASQVDVSLFAKRVSSAPPRDVATGSSSSGCWPILFFLFFSLQRVSTTATTIRVGQHLRAKPDVEVRSFHPLLLLEVIKQDY